MAAVDEVLAALDADGYTVVEGLLDEDEVATVRAALDPMIDAMPVGRNGFEGFATRRVYGLPGRTRALDRLFLDPFVLEVADTLLEHHLLCAAVAISIEPGEPAQYEHHDDGLYPLPRPHPEVLLSTMWALDDFTADNGSTVMLPGSHRWPSGRTPQPDDERRPVVMPAGSVALYIGSTWHGGGANHSDQARLGVTIEYVASWLRTQEAYTVTVPWDVVPTLPPRLQDLLGWEVRPPFMGYVDGRSPKRRLPTP
jgi:ectoine hydroxylase-related dioxygenase (phytanoyl-CoA dioxygenase family)